MERKIGLLEIKEERKSGLTERESERKCGLMEKKVQVGLWRRRNADFVKGRGEEIETSLH
jgi:hypothetical protein